MVLGIISSYFLPILLKNNISKHFYQSIKKAENDGNFSGVNKIKDQKEARNYIKNIFCFERLIDLNILVDEHNNRIQIFENQNIQLKNLVEKQKKEIE